MPLLEPQAMMLSRRPSSNENYESRLMGAAIIHHKNQVLWQTCLDNERGEGWVGL